MNTRRGVLKAMAASAAAGGVTRIQAAVPRQASPGLRVPDGVRFAGMAGAYSAMFTPFFRQGEKEGQLNEEAIERLVEYAVKTGLTGPFPLCEPVRLLQHDADIRGAGGGSHHQRRRVLAAHPQHRDSLG